MFSVVGTNSTFESVSELRMILIDLYLQPRDLLNKPSLGACITKEEIEEIIFKEH